MEFVFAPLVLRFNCKLFSFCTFPTMHVLASQLEDPLPSALGAASLERSLYERRSSVMVLFT